MPRGPAVQAEAVRRQADANRVGATDSRAGRLGVVGAVRERSVAPDVESIEAIAAAARLPAVSRRAAARAAAQASGGPKEGAMRAVRGESRRSSASRGAREGRRQPSERRGVARRRARSAPARITRAVGCAQALLRQTGSRWSARARGGRARVPTAPGGSCHAACPATPAHPAVQARERLRHASQPIWAPRASRLFIDDLPADRL